MKPDKWEIALGVFFGHILYDIFITLIKKFL